MGILFDKSLETGNELIDVQHQELINRVNKLSNSCNTAVEKNVAVQTLDFLMDYTEFHFREEEQLQKECNYPGIEPHKAQHAQFVQAVEELRQMLEEEEGPTEEFVAAVNRNIVEWLLNHIQVYDKEVAAYAKKK